LDAGSARTQSFLTGWRGLGRFWVIVLSVVGILGGTLQLLGPPGGERVTESVAAGHPAASAAAVPNPEHKEAAAKPAHAEAQSATPASQPRPLVVQRRVGPVPDSPGRDQPGAVVDPDPALLAPLGDGTDATLPRIASDGRMPMQAYAAGFDASSRRPRVAVLLAGIGLSEAESMTAVNTLPGGITFAVSPYGSAVDRVLPAARLAQHEYLVSIPMEPQGFPLNDPGNQALMTKLGRPENLKRLFWAMSRFGGYVGGTGALGDMRGERFAGLSDQMLPVLREFSERGLFYVDPRPGEPPPALVWGRVVDVLIDVPTEAGAIDARLAELERIARERGSALGLAGAPRPVTVARLAAWAASLGDRGLALAPVSAIVQPPAKEAAVTEGAARPVAPNSAVSNGALVKGTPK
jgi:polysaccharide deacetylase 2 family uncharacterized protein YibQ